MVEEFDVVVVGGGPTGENVADRVVRGGLTAALVESELLGGECSYWACMPSKALLRGSEALAAAKRVRGAAAAVTGGLDAAGALRRRDAFAARWKDDGQERWARGRGIEVVRGRGRLDGVKEVAVDTPGGGPRRLRARHAVAVCTGSEAVLPPVPGLAESGVWTTREATSAAAAPGSLAVVGGGVAACELAAAWAGFGTEVTMLVRGGALLAGHEPFAGELVADGLRGRGVRVLLRTSVAAARRGGDGLVRLDTGGGEVLAEQVLVAAGRAPRTRGLGLGTVGLDGAGWLAVDDACRVAGVDGGWLYAVGDVNGRHLLTHQGKYQARACGAAILAAAAGREVDTGAWAASAATADRLATPSVVFTDPQVAAVGRTEAQARADGVRVRAVEYDLGAVAGAALHADRYTGRAKLVVDEDRRTVVGATFAGPEVGELLHAATVAVVGEVPLERLWHAVPSYPTVSEVWLRLLEAYGL